MLLKSTFWIMTLLLLPTTVFAKSELAAQLSWKNATYKISAELYYDKAAKKPDLWVEYLQGKTDDDRIAFKATSLTERMKDADIRLAATPLTKVDGQATLIFNAFSVASGEYNGNRGMALLFKFPVEELSNATIKAFKAQFPSAIVNDPATGRPKYVKALLCRVTESQVYPVAAFDAELDL